MSPPLNPTPLPAEAGFAMPPEWQAHERCWMAWPCRTSVWGDRLFEARAAYAQVARTIARFEPVTMAVPPELADEARGLLGDRIQIFEVPLDDSWMRDIGPSFLLNGDGLLAGIDWRFNAWGGKYETFGEDAACAARVLFKVGAQPFAAPFVLEGGSFHVDGAGTVMVTEQCLLNENRNPEMDRAGIEQALKAWLGARHVVWLGRGLVDDETDGHVDNLACFARAGVVLALAETDPNDANYAALADNLARLRDARDADGKPFEVVTLPQPAWRVEEGRRLSLSYINFYPANGAIVMPSFDDPADAEAERIMAAVFPERRIVAVPALEIVRGGGGIHCITQQQPASRGLA